MLITGHDLHGLSFTTQPTCPEMAALTMNLALPHQSLSKTACHRHAHRPARRRHLLNRWFSSPDDPSLGKSEERKKKGRAYSNNKDLQNPNLSIKTEKRVETRVMSYTMQELLLPVVPAGSPASVWLWGPRTLLLVGFVPYPL